MKHFKLCKAKQNKTKRSGDMELKFGVNPLDVFRKNDVYGRTTDGSTTTDDGRPRDDSSSAVQCYRHMVYT